MTPINQRLLNELQFWLRIMKEHSLFLRLGFPCNETQLIQMAQNFESRFAQLEQKVYVPKQMLRSNALPKKH